MWADAPQARARLTSASSVEASSVERGAVLSAPAERTEPALAPPPEPAEGARWLLTAGVGAHIGAPHSYAAPSLLARVGARLGRWEVLGFTQWDVSHVALEDDPADIRVWGIDAGIAAGRREPVGLVTLTFGLQIGASWTRWESPAPPPSGDIIFIDGMVTEGVEPRVGVSAGVLVPLGVTTRLRPSLSFDVAPLDLGETYDAIGAPVSWRSVMLALSVEFEP